MNAQDILKELQSLDAQNPGAWPSWARNGAVILVAVVLVLLLGGCSAAPAPTAPPGPPPDTSSLRQLDDHPLLNPRGRHPPVPPTGRGHRRRERDGPGRRPRVRTRVFRRDGHCRPDRPGPTIHGWIRG